MSSGITSALAGRGSPRGTAIEPRHQPEEPRNSGGRSAGKGRRRRAAAEQRRIEQQRWGDYLTEDEELPSPSPSPPNRRRNRRSIRRTALQDAQDDLDEYLVGHVNPACRHSGQNEALDLDLALAISLSLADSGSGVLASSHLSEASLGSSLDMSYENLVNLENVRVVASKDTVETLPLSVFGGLQDGDSSEEICPICQGEFVEEDVLLVPPCKHSLHRDCGREWLTKYSKACPICKCDVCE